MFNVRELIAAAAAAALGLGASSALAGTTIHDTLMTPGAFFAQATIDGCDNSDGPYITLDGELSLGGINGKVILKNNRKGTHKAQRDISESLTLLEDGETIRFNKQPSRGGVGGNPWIYIQLFDEGWHPMSDKVLLGRCVQGIVPLAFDMLLPTDATLDVGAGECKNHPGPIVTLEGELVLGGINGKLIFENNRKKRVHYKEVPVEVGFSILGPGDVLPVPKQPSSGGAGGNPLIYFQFADPDGKALSGEFFLGRCTQIGD